MSSQAADRPIRHALKRVAVTLKQRQLPFALAGTYASWARGGPEPEHDADFLVRASDVDSVCDALADEGLRIERPPEDWLAKAFDDSCCPPAMVDLIHAVNQVEVTDAMLQRANDVEVDSVRMPVITATDFIRLRLVSLSEHACDFAALLPHVRALREQIDWPLIRQETAGMPFADAFLLLADRLGVTDVSIPS